MQANPDKIYIEVSWEYRPQTLRQCTESFLTFLQKLAAYQPDFFSTWYEEKETIEETRQNPIQFTYTWVKNTFSPTDKEDELPVFNYFTRYTNGQKFPETMMIEASLGVGMDIAPNSCMIELPRKGPSYDFYKKPSHLLTLMKMMIAYWDPRYIEIYNYKQAMELPLELPLSDKKLLQIIEQSFYT